MNVVRPRLPIRALVLEIIIIIATTVAITETIANEVAVPTRGDTTAAMDIIETETVTRVAIVIPTETGTEETVESAGKFLFCIVIKCFYSLNWLCLAVIVSLSHMYVLNYVVLSL